MAPALCGHRLGWLCGRLPWPSIFRPELGKIVIVADRRLEDRKADGARIVARSHLEVGRARTADKIVRPMMDRPPAGPQRLVRDLPAAASEQVDSARIFACHKPEARDAAHQTMTLSNSCIAVAIRASSEPPWAGGKLSLLAGRGRAWGTEMPINRLLANSELGPDAIYLCEGDPKLAYAIFLRIALARAHWRRRTAFVILFFW